MAILKGLQGLFFWKRQSFITYSTLIQATVIENYGLIDTDFLTEIPFSKHIWRKNLAN